MKEFFRLLGLLKSFQIEIDGAVAGFVREFSMNITSKILISSPSFDNSSEEYQGTLNENAFRIRRIRFTFNPMSGCIDAVGTMTQENGKLRLQIDISPNWIFIGISLLYLFIILISGFSSAMIPLIILWLIFSYVALHLGIGSFYRDLSAEMVTVERQMKRS